MKNFTYNDVLNLPVRERRLYLGFLTKDAITRQEKAEELGQKAQTKGGKGSRQTRVSGTALKNKLKSGEVK